MTTDIHTPAVSREVVEMVNALIEERCRIHSANYGRGWDRTPGDVKCAMRKVARPQVMWDLIADQAARLSSMETDLARAREALEPIRKFVEEADRLYAESGLTPAKDNRSIGVHHLASGGVLTMGDLRKIAALGGAGHTAEPPVCARCNGTGLILEHPADVPFSQSLAAIGDCPECSDTTDDVEGVGGERRPGYRGSVRRDSEG